MSVNIHRERLFHLKQKGFNPKVIYDIGAFQGNWSRMAHEIFPQSKCYLFEANEDNRTILQRQPFPFFIDLLGNEEREAIFYCTKGAPCSGESLFCENTSHFQESKLQKRTANMTTLFSSVQKYCLPPADLIKIDVQGAEKWVIEGGKEVVCKAEAIILETKVLEYNRGAPLCHELIPFMDALGYRIYDILEWHYLATGELNEVDYLFLKHDSVFIAPKQAR